MTDRRPPVTRIPLNRLAVLATIIGVLTGLFVAALNWTVIGVERLIYGMDHLDNHDPTSHVSPIRLAVTLLVLGVFTSWAWYLVHRLGRREVSVVGAMRGEKMPVAETIASSFLQVTTVAAGAPVGQENAPRIAGGLVAERFCRWLDLDQDAKQVLIAAAAGGALGASFHLPLAGALFALEILLVRMSPRNVVITMVTTVAAVATTGLFVEVPAVFATVPLTESPVMLVAAVVVGVVAGLAGHWFSQWANRAAGASPTGRALLWQMPVGFGVIALIAYLVPDAVANARWTSATLLDEGMALKTLLLVGFLRLVVFLIAFRVGTVGGTLIPAFALGSMVGGVAGHLLEPVIGVPVAACALLGAAAFLSTTMAAPLFGLIAAVEFTDMEPQGYLPAFLAVASAVLTVRAWSVLSNREQRTFPVTYASWTGELK
ncbi:chloride channel protein [Corynebacterium halotolerans]|uniref:chloride channel protein n=1 Tax=Corynebacterium halotolerans TaxID=225326 RepID=UPI00034B4A14